MIWYDKNSFNVTNLVVTSKKSSELILTGNIYQNPYINRCDSSIMYGLKDALDNTAGAEIMISDKNSQIVYSAKKIYYQDVINIIINEK